MIYVVRMNVADDTTPLFNLLVPFPDVIYKKVDGVEIKWKSSQAQHSLHKSAQDIFAALREYISSSKSHFNDSACTLSRQCHALQKYYALNLSSSAHLNRFYFSPYINLNTEIITFFLLIHLLQHNVF